MSVYDAPFHNVLCNILYLKIVAMFFLKLSCNVLFTSKSSIVIKLWGIQDVCCVGFKMSAVGDSRCLLCWFQDVCCVGFKMSAVGDSRCLLCWIQDVCCGGFGSAKAPLNQCSNLQSSCLLLFSAITIAISMSLLTLTSIFTQKKNYITNASSLLHATLRYAVYVSLSDCPATDAVTRYCISSQA